MRNKELKIITNQIDKIPLNATYVKLIKAYLGEAFYLGRRTGLLDAQKIFSPKNEKINS